MSHSEATGEHIGQHPLWMESPFPIEKNVHFISSHPVGNQSVIVLTFCRVAHSLVRLARVSPIALAHTFRQLYNHYVPIIELSFIFPTRCR